MAVFASAFRWLRRKKYQYEVTFSLYMLTPIEKIIFNSIIFIIFSMVIIAAYMYLPHHIAFLTNRAWFYYHGEDATAVKVLPFGGDVEPTTMAGAIVETARAALDELKYAGQDTGREL